MYLFIEVYFYSRYVFTVIENHAKGFLAKEDIEEAVEDTFISLWRHRGSVSAELPLMPYIAAVAKNAARNRMRTVNVKMTASGDGVSLNDYGYIRVETVSDILGAAGKLNKKQYEVFIRYYFYGEAMDMISTGMGIGESDARTTLHRARESIKGYLSERGYSDEIV